MNILLLCGWLIILGFHRLLYGPFDSLECEELYPKFVIATLDSVLTTNLLSIDVDMEFVLLFIALLAARIWAWIGEWRLETLLQQRSTHMRSYASVFAGLLLSLACGVFMFGCIFKASRRTDSAKLVIMFGFEHLTLCVSTLSTGLSFTLSVKDAYARLHEESMRRARSAVGNEVTRPVTPGILTVAYEGTLDIAAGGWEHFVRPITGMQFVDTKPLSSLIRNIDIIDTCVECAVLFINLSYFSFCVVSYRRPIVTSHILVTSHSLLTRLRDFLHHRIALKEINAQYSDATTEQVVQAKECAICWEIMWIWRRDHAVGAPTDGRYTRAACRKQASRPKRLPCGHVFHFGCLQRWFERQPVCPLCRSPVWRKS